MQNTPAGVTDAYHRIQEPVSGLCIKLNCIPAAAGDAPRIVPKLVPKRCASRFPNRRAAEQAFACYTPNEPLEIVRFDA